MGCPATILKHTKRRAFEYLKKKIKKKISELGFYTEHYWVAQSTFGAVLCDFVPGRTGPSIIGPHKALYELVSNNITYLVLSNNLTRNFKYYKVDGETLLVLNINGFKKFIKTFSDKHKRIQLFLIKELTKEEEDIINDWIDSKHQQSKKIKYASAEEIIENLPKNDPKKASDVVVRIENYFEQQIISNFEYYEKKLKEFEDKVNSKDTQESELRDKLKDNLWIIDFKFQNINQFVCEKEVEINKGEGDKGKIDLWVSRNKTQRKKDIIIELKLADEKKVKSLINYRKKEAIGSNIGKALSQLIIYLESKDISKENIKEGLLIIGRMPEGSFLELFNKYLHGIQIKTYKQLIDDCRSVIDSFKMIREEPKKEDKQ